MSEQKMPALPERDFDGPDGVAGYYAPAMRQAIREAIEFGRQQERERLEPLRVAVEAERAASEGYVLGDVNRADLFKARVAVQKAVRTLLEQTE